MCRIYEELFSNWLRQPNLKGYTDISSKKIGSEYMQRCSTSQKQKWKPEWLQFTVASMAVIKKENNKCWQGCETWDSIFAIGSINGATALKSSLLVPQNAKHALFLGIYPKEMKT